MDMKCAVVLIFAITFVVVNGDNQHLICKQVEDVFSGEQTASTQASTRMKQGIQGKRGAPGIKGDRGETGARGEFGRKGESGPTGQQGIRGEQGEIGPQGPPAIVDYSRIETEVLERMASSIAALKTKINNISATMFKMDERITAHQKQTLCDVFYNGKCFHAIIHSSADINFQQAQSFCENIGWKLANIYDLTHHDMIEEYIREKTPGHYWLGMTYDRQTGRVTDTHGNIVNSAQIKWHSSYPDRDTNIVIEAHSSSSSNEGLKTKSQSSNWIGVLCEM